MSDLSERLVGAYRPYVLARCEARGWDETALLQAALDEGEIWLEESLEAVLSLPFQQQRRGPLEVFQEAMKFPTQALVEAGIPRPERDQTAVRALPGDYYGLAPASTRELGEDVWSAHMAWGAQKAAALARPVVMVASRNLLDSSRIEASASAAGFSTARWNESLVGTASLVCVDLEQEGAPIIVEAAVRADVPVVAYGPHRDVDLLEAARTAGADHVMPRSAFFSRLDLAGWAT